MRLLAERVAKATGPFKQIINQIQKMIFRLNKEQTDEDNHKNWCDNELQTTQKDHENKSADLAALAEKIAALKAEVEKLESEIQAREENIALLQADFKEASELNVAEKKDLAISLEDAIEAQTALTNAIAVLQKYYDGNASFIQQQPDMGAHGGAFTNTSGSASVLTMLEKVLSDYGALEASTKAQDEQRESKFAQFQKDTELEISRDRTNVKAKTAQMTQANKKLAAAEKKHKSTTKQFEAIEQYLEDLKPNCGDGSAEFENAYEDRKTKRSAEIGALKGAEKLLGEAFNEKASFLQRGL
jgi:DNA repair exonuclease SbcCD ATPase subunit